MSYRESTYVPRYRQHKATGQAVVTLDGRDFYLGRWRSSQSRREYDRLIGEWIANGRRLPSTAEPDLTVTELIAAYFRFAKQYYRKNGEPTGTLEGIRVALRILRQTYGHTSAIDFGPLALKALQQKMIQLGQSRRYLNDNIDRIRRLFKWAVSEQLLPPSIHQALQTVPGIAKGRTTARESAPVRPVEADVVAQTLPHLPAVVADMVRVQLLTGCRPAEVCIMRPCDIEQCGDVWRYVPMTHKTEHHGRERTIFLGPKAQAILAPYFARESTDFCFSPTDSERLRNEQRRRERKSAMTPSQAKRRPRANRQRKPGPCYTTDSYRRAIARACELAGVETWAPNRLRHSTATRVRKEYGLEAAQVTLGHASADVSQIYAERDLSKAAAIMKEIG